MIRSPLRPLVKILRARERGVNPDSIEWQEKVKRLYVKVQKEKKRAKQRILLLAMAFFLAFSAVGVKMTILASVNPIHHENKTSKVRFDSNRLTITDRNGIVLATNLKTFSLYAEERKLVDKSKTAEGLSRIFPDLDSEELKNRLNDGRNFFSSVYLITFHIHSRLKQV